MDLKRKFIIVINQPHAEAVAQGVNGVPLSNERTVILFTTVTKAVEFAKRFGLGRHNSALVSTTWEEIVENCKGYDNATIDPDAPDEHGIGDLFVTIPLR